MWGELPNTKTTFDNNTIFKLVDPFGEFIVCIDTYKEWMGGVLMQNGHVIFYESHKLKDHERNYEVHDWELASIMHALKI